VTTGTCMVLMNAWREGRYPMRGSVPASVASCSRCDDIITTAHLRSLARNSYVVIDDVMGHQEVNAAIVDIKKCSPVRQDEESVRTDRVTFVDSRTKNSGLLEIRSLLRGIGNAMEKKMFMGFGTENIKMVVPDQIQVAVYDVSATFYKAHRDGVSEGFFELGLLQWLKYSCYRKRNLTCIIYLNEEREWDSKRDGGCLRLYLGADLDDTIGDTATSVVDIQPKGGRLVLFDSQAILHEVLPTFRERIAATIWVART